MCLVRWGGRPGNKHVLGLVEGASENAAEGESTFCYACGSLLIDRVGYQILRCDLQDGKCPKCQAEIDGVWQ